MPIIKSKYAIKFKVMLVELIGVEIKKTGVKNIL